MKMGKGDTNLADEKEHSAPTVHDETHMSVLDDSGNSAGDRSSNKPQENSGIEEQRVQIENSKHGGHKPVGKQTSKFESSNAHEKIANAFRMLEAGVITNEEFNMLKKDALGTLQLEQPNQSSRNQTGRRPQVQGQGPKTPEAKNQQGGAQSGAQSVEEWAGSISLEFLEQVHQLESPTHGAGTITSAEKLGEKFKKAAISVSSPDKGGDIIQDRLSSSSIATNSADASQDSANILNQSAAVFNPNDPNNTNNGGTVFPFNKYGHTQRSEETGDTGSDESGMPAKFSNNKHNDSNYGEFHNSNSPWESQQQVQGVGQGLENASSWSLSGINNASHGAGLNYQGGGFDFESGGIYGHKGNSYNSHGYPAGPPSHSSFVPDSGFDGRNNGRGGNQLRHATSSDPGHRGGSGHHSQGGHRRQNDNYNNNHNNPWTQQQASYGGGGRGGMGGLASPWQQPGEMGHYGSGGGGGGGGGNGGGGNGGRHGGGGGVGGTGPVDIQLVMQGVETRTTLMVRNIPNKYTQQMLLKEIDVNHTETYDFFYLPIDFKNKCNKGYAFINFMSPQAIVPFYREFSGQRWKVFNSEKICKLSYARIQGKAAMIARFQNSSLMKKENEYRPLIFHSIGPRKGLKEDFPAPQQGTDGDTPPMASNGGGMGGRSSGRGGGGTPGVGLLGPPSPSPHGSHNGHAHSQMVGLQQQSMPASLFNMAHVQGVGQGRNAAMDYAAPPGAPPGMDEYNAWNSTSA